MNLGNLFFDKKPVVMKRWSEGQSMDIYSISKVPIWIQLPNLSPKLWSAPGLSQIGSLLGRPIEADVLTQEKARMCYARIMVEVNFNEELPNTVDFVNDEGNLMKQRVVYEWRPITCSHCHMMGHSESDCRKNSKEKLVWRPVQKDRRTDTPPEVQDNSIEQPSSETENMQEVPEEMIAEEEPNTTHIEEVINDGFTTVTTRYGRRANLRKRGNGNSVQNGSVGRGYGRLGNPPP